MFASRKLVKNNDYPNIVCDFFVSLQMVFDGNNAVLLIATTYEEDSGTFTCRVTSSAGQVKTSAKLNVKSKN